MRKALTVAAASVLAVLAAAPALADPVTACRLTAGEQQVAFPSRAPPALVAAVNRDLGRYAFPGQPFSCCDAVGPNPPPFKRLIWVRSLGSRWVVAYEQGGIAHLWQARAYQVRGGTATPAGETRAEGGDFCGPVERLLRGASAPAPGGGKGGKAA